MSTRIYLVTNTDTDRVRLIEAASAAAAIRHVTAARYSATVASAKAVATYMRAGATIETAGSNEEEEAKP